MLLARATILPLLAGSALLAAICAVAPACAQTASITNAAMGKVAAANSGITTLRFSSSAGTVTTVSGSGGRISTGTVRFNVAIPCTVSSRCNTKNLKVTVGSTGTPTGRAGSLTNFTVTAGTASIVSGPTGTNPITFTIGPIGSGQTKTLFIGADLPIYGDDQTGKATGAASSAMYVTTADTTGTNPITSGGSISATVSRRLSMAQILPALNFGTVVKPKTGTGGVAFAATTGAYVATGGVRLNSPTPTRGQFTVTGEGGQVVSITVPTTFTLANGANTITVTTSNSGAGSQILSNSLGSAGTYSFYVGGTFSYSSSTVTGAYTGSYTVGVAYN
jgi:hypothetical protein